MTRADFQRLAGERLGDAKALLQNTHLRHSPIDGNETCIEDGYVYFVK